MKLVLMATDECGDDFRLHGSEFLEQEFEYKDFDHNDQIELETFWFWCDRISAKAKEEWRSIYGEEVRNFRLEEVIDTHRYFRYW